MGHGPDRAPETKVAVRVVEWVTDDRVERLETVFCPFRAASGSVPDCRACQAFARLEGEQASLVCSREPPISLDEARLLVEERRICTGSDSLAERTSLGALAHPHVVCVSWPTSLAATARTLAASSALGVVVVDAARRPLAFVPRDEVWPHSQSQTLAPVGACAHEPFLILSEEASLASALDRLISRHQRVIVTVDGKDRTTGLVLDVQILHWFARISHPPEA
jgi:hypothetical protein